MGGKIIGALCCMLCAMPFLVLGGLKNHPEPLSFWSGDDSLKKRVKNVPEYNRAMSRMYRRYGVAWCVTAVLMAVLPVAGLVGMVLCCTLGVLLLYRGYKKALAQFA